MVALRKVLGARMYVHWLPIDSPIQYKLHSLCYNYLNSTASGYKLPKFKTINAARFVFRVPETHHISFHLASLHWLPIDSPIQYKLHSLCYNYLSSTASGS